MGSAEAQYYFSPKFTQIGEPANYKTENDKEKKTSHSLLCEFNRSQMEQSRQGCSERSAFQWLKEDRPKYAVPTKLTIVIDVKYSKRRLTGKETIL